MAEIRIGLLEGPVASASGAARSDWLVKVASPGEMKVRVEYSQPAAAGAGGRESGAPGPY